MTILLSPDMDSLKNKIAKFEEELERLQNRCDRLKIFIAYEQKKHLTEEIYFESFPAKVVLSYTMVLSNYDEREYHLQNIVGPRSISLEM